jgi:hypothetical protein
LVRIDGTNASYAGNFIQMVVSTNASNAGGNNDNGTVITFGGVLFAAAVNNGVAPPPPDTGGTPGPVPSPGSGSNFFNNGISVTWNYRIDIVYPETTNLTDTWGTVTIT